MKSEAIKTTNILIPNKLDEVNNIDERIKNLIEKIENLNPSPAMKKLVTTIINEPHQTQKAACMKCGYSSTAALNNGEPARLLLDLNRELNSLLTIKDSTIEKMEAIKILKNIAQTSDSESIKIQAIERLGKFLGWDMPIRTQNENYTQTILKYIEDK